MQRSGLIDGRQVRAARAALGLSLTEMGQLADLHRNSVHRVEGMGELPRLSYAGDRIAEALEPLGVTFAQEPGEAVVRFRRAEPATKQPAA